MAAQGRFWRFLGPGGYRVEVATKGDKPVQEHMSPAPELGRGTFMRVIDENGLAVYVDTNSYDRVVEVPWVSKTDRFKR